MSIAQFLNYCSTKLILFLNFIISILSPSKQTIEKEESCKVVSEGYLLIPSTLAKFHNTNTTRN